jgi:hypothetical protein
LCGGRGHSAHNCPNKGKPPGKEPPGKDQPRVKRVLAAPAGSARERDILDQGLVTPCILDGKPVMALVDSGANTSFVSRDWVLKAGLPIRPVTGVIQQCIDGSEMPRLGVLKDVILENGKYRVKVTLEVVDLTGEQQMLIGLNLFQQLGFKISGVPFLWPQVPEVAQAATEVEKQVEDRPAGVGEDGVHEEWKQVLADNAAIPQTSVCKLPEAVVHIDTGTAKPIYVRQYDTPKHLHDRVSARVAEWVANGWVKPAPQGNPWNFTLLVAPKGEDDIRVCLDARRLNEVIVEQVDSSLPNIHHLIQNLGKFKWISVIDLQNSYQQFPIAPEDQHKVSFTWAGQQWMFITMPYGIKIMTSIEQRVMEGLLRKYFVQPFQDDSPIVDLTTAAHVKRVREVLEALTYEAGLRLRVSKCKFFQTEARLLGYRVTREGIHMDIKKVESIQAWERPVDGKGVQRFLGAVNYNRIFSPTFANKCAPLEELRQVVGVINWTAEQAAAFEEVKQFFVQDGSVRFIDWGEPVVPRPPSPSPGPFFSPPPRGVRLRSTGWTSASPGLQSLRRSMPQSRPRRRRR